MIKLCFDYGHGGQDSGASYKGRKESDDVLRIGKAVAAQVRRHGVMVDETRTSDTTVSLGVRSQLENKGSYDYFISFHRNAYKPEVGKGAETYVYLKGGVKANSLAKSIQVALINVGFANRGVKAANFHVLRETRAPAVLIEIGFIDNTQDNKLFDTKFDEIVIGITKAILSEVGVGYKEPNPAVKKYYRVQVGAYSNKVNAEAMLKKIQAAGFEGMIKHD